MGAVVVAVVAVVQDRSSAMNAVNAAISHEIVVGAMVEVATGAETAAGTAVETMVVIEAVDIVEVVARVADPLDVTGLVAEKLSNTFRMHLFNIWIQNGPTDWTEQKNLSDLKIKIQSALLVELPKDFGIFFVEQFYT